MDGSAPYPEFLLGDRPVGIKYLPLVIAEIGINHGGSLKVAKAMVDAASRAGAEVVKHQTHTLYDEMALEAESAIPGNANESIWEIMRECALTESEERELFAHARSRGLTMISTPFSRAAVDRLVDLDVPAFKIGSGECSNYPLIEYVAQAGLPVILSTGMHDLSSVRTAATILRSAGVPFALLHTTNLYPTPPALVRLGAMRQLAEAFPDAVVGLSDHTVDNRACLAAIALGASILERHFTDSHERRGPDISSSMDESELRGLLSEVPYFTAIRGGSKDMVEEEAVTRNFATASVCAVRDIQAGEVLTTENIWPMRPAGGHFSPSHYYELLGSVAKTAIPARTQLHAEQILRCS